jgi:hypothetical protein
MQITIKTRNIILACVVLISGIFVFGWYLGIQKNKRATQGLITAQDTVINRFATEINNLTVYVSQKRQEVTTLQGALKNSELTREELRKLNISHLQEITRLKLKIDTLIDSIPNTGVVIRDTCLATDQAAIILPFSFQKSDRWIDRKSVV